MGRKCILQVICLQLKTLPINFYYAPPQTWQRTRVQEKESKGFSTMRVVKSAAGHWLKDIILRNGASKPLKCVYTEERAFLPLLRSYMVFLLETQDFQNFLKPL